ncbi:MAG: hypothetical protein DMG76_23785 [Acidobacteria bacterium]|nr:MAG: hypothetical protein DMG76_23785 [Acidobacteriota bacterium]
MPLTYIPLALNSLDISDPRQARAFQLQICDFLSAAFTAAGLSEILNGALLLKANALAPRIVDLGTITINQTVPVEGAAFLYLRLSSAITQTRTLSLTNLAQGAVVSVIAVVSANSLSLKMAATDPAGQPYTITAINTATGGLTDLVSSAVVMNPSTNLFSGQSGFIGTSATPDLTVFYR